MKLNAAAIKMAKKIQKLDSSAAKWIAADALRELKSAAVQKRLKRNIQSYIKKLKRNTISRF
jgi:hypothetical protein